MHRFADLHLHTNFSDSTLSPAEVVEAAFNKGIHCIAITDHDTLEGVPDAQSAGKTFGVEVIGGVELSSEINGKDIHILGYFLSGYGNNLQKELSKMQQTRCERMVKMIEKLKAFGIDNISIDEVAAHVQTNSVGRMHLAKELVSKGWVRDTKTAFDKYLAQEASCYVPKYKQSPFEAIEFIRKHGGVAVLAHPMITNVDELIPSFVRAGLNGLECYYPFTSDKIINYYVKLARKYNICVTGGSDCHGANKSFAAIGMVNLNYEYVDRLRQLSQNNS